MSKTSRKRAEPDTELSFFGEPIPIDEALYEWPFRYSSNNNAIVEKRSQAKHHYLQAIVDGVIFNLLDDVYVTSEKDMPNYIAKIIEFFEAVDGEPYFRARWFYRAEDTVINKEIGNKIIPKNRVFLSDVEDDNPLTCIYSGVKIVKLSPVIGTEERTIPPCDYYYDMKYSLAHLTFSSVDDVLPKNKTSVDDVNIDHDDSSTISSEVESNCVNKKPQGNEKYLLDMYSGCGAMSTGLTIGAKLSNMKLVSKWAVDINPFACKSLEINHPETYVRNEAAEDFLSLLKEWRKLCQKFSLIPSTEPIESESESEDEEEEEGDEIVYEDVPPEEFEVERFLAICFGNPNKLDIPSSSLHLRVRWKGYGEEEDSWEPLDGLGKCRDKLKEFVTNGFKSNLLPLPGGVHFLCGGPPCQGISGFNRFRDKTEPLKDEKNRQLLVYLETVEYLKPNYVLMENVVDLLKFSEGYLARFAVARLVSMCYQTRLGMMIAGCYGIPQVRNRVFLWAALPTEKLPPYPLPTHHAPGKRLTLNEFKEIQVGYSQMDLLDLKPALTLEVALSDLPKATNDEENEERVYEGRHKTDFQKFIRLSRAETIIPIENNDTTKARRILFDHQPLKLKDDDLERVCKIPKKKGANFRDLEGVLVEKNRVKFDLSIDRPKLKSGKFLVPDYAMSFVEGRSKKPFGRLWWDEVVKTVVTRAEPHNQCVIHPEQDRVLTVRENARIQGFPDFYKLHGPIKEKYIQVGNAVAFPVGVALGYAFGMASQGSLTDNQPVIALPSFEYPKCLLEVAEEHSE